jgi:hypothetical protein
MSGEIMKFRIVVIATIGFELACTGFAGDYKYLVGKGYRWVTVDGPYACSTEEEVRRITTHRTDATELQMVEDGQAYYLIPGTMVQVVKENPASGMSQVNLGGITKPLWTCTKFLGTRPIRDTYGVIETPETSGLIAGADAGVIQLTSVGSAPMSASSQTTITPENPGPDTSSMNQGRPNDSTLHTKPPRMMRKVHHEQ